MNSFVLLTTSSTGLSDIVSFFNNYATSGDVDGALVSAGFLFKMALWAIIFVGAVSMAIWIARIAVDIFLLVTRGTKIAESGLAKLGTGKSGASADVKSYIKDNGMEILLVLVLITFLITGWLFRLVAVALGAFGALGNKLFDLDIEGTFSNADITAYNDQLDSRRVVSLKAEYEQHLGNLRTEVTRLYEYAKEGRDKADASYQKSMKLYTNYMYRAQAISSKMDATKLASINTKAEYFKQHLRQKGEQVCNKAFIDTAIEQQYIGAGVSAVACQ